MNVVNRWKNYKKIRLSSRICLCCNHCIHENLVGWDENFKVFTKIYNNNFLICNLKHHPRYADYADESDFHIGYTDEKGNKFIDGKDPPNNCPYRLEHIFHNESRKEIRSKLSKTERMLEVLKNRHKDYNPEKEYDVK